MSDDEDSDVDQEQDQWHHFGRSSSAPVEQNPAIGQRKKRKKRMNAAEERQFKRFIWKWKNVDKYKNRYGVPQTGESHKQFWRRLVKPVAQQAQQNEDIDQSDDVYEDADAGDVEDEDQDEFYVDAEEGVDADEAEEGDDDYDEDAVICNACRLSAGELITPCQCHASFGSWHYNCLCTWITSANNDTCNQCTAPFRDPRIVRPAYASLAMEYIVDGVILDIKIYAWLVFLIFALYNWMTTTDHKQLQLNRNIFLWLSIWFGFTLLIEIYNTIQYVHENRNREVELRDHPDVGQTTTWSHP